MTDTPLSNLPPELLAALRTLQAATEQLTKLETSAQAQAHTKKRTAHTRTSAGKHTGAHYDAHHPNPGLDMWTTDPANPDEHTVQLDDPSRVVYCAYHHTQHRLSECVYVTRGLGGAHWVCREVARSFGWQELVIH